MKPFLPILFFSASALFGNTYLVPSIKKMEQNADLVIIGSIEGIKKSKERELGTQELAEKEITIFVHASLKGITKEKRITVRHAYDDTATLDGIEALKKKCDSFMEKIEELEMLFATKREASIEFAGSKEAREIKKKIEALQKEFEPFLEHMQTLQVTPYAIPDFWYPSESDEYLIFLKKEDGEYAIPNGNFSFRKLSYLNDLPKHALELK